MASVNEHCKDCEKFIGKGMLEAHKFLDQYVEVFPVGYFVDYHRTFLHNTYGVKTLTARHGYIGWCAAVLHLTRDYVGGTIDHCSLERMMREFPRRLMWFDKMAHAYEPQPHVVRAWKGKSLITLATE